MYRFTCLVAVEKPQQEGGSGSRGKRATRSWFPFLPPASRELIKAQGLVNKYETLPLSD